MLKRLTFAVLVVVVLASKANAQISFINAWTGSATSSTTLTISTAGGTQAQVNDVYISNTNSFPSAACPAGWTTVVPVTNDSANGHLISCLKVVAAGDIGASYLFPTNNYTTGGIADFRGINTTTPVDIAGNPGTSNQCSGTTATAASISPATTGDLLLWFGGSNGVSFVVNTWPAGFQASPLWNIAAVGSTHEGSWANYELGISSGATGTQAATLSGSPAGCNAVLVALAPAASATPTPTPGPTPVGGLSCGSFIPCLQYGRPYGPS